MAIDRRFINSNDTPFSTASLLSFFIVADTAKRGRIGNLEYRAIAGKSAETAAHILPLEILEPPQGYAHCRPFSGFMQTDRKQPQ